MADIKERKKDTGSIKEKRTSIPKELLKQETIHSIQWARQQVQEAAESEQQENEGAGAGMPWLSVPQIRRPSRSKLKRETYDTPTTASKSTTESSIMSTGTAEESAPSRVQEAYAHAQEQGRKLAIRQETEKTAKIKERVENAPQFDSVWEQESETSTRSNPVRENPSFHSHTSGSVREGPIPPSVSSTVNLQSAPAEHHEAPPKAIKSADKYKHAGINGNPHTVKQAGRRVKTPEASTAKKTALTNNWPAKSAAKRTGKVTKKGTAKLAKAVEKAAVSAVKSIGALLGSSAGLVAVLLVVIVLAAGLLLSPLGIFFSGDADGDVTLQQVMSELNTAFADRITEIENANAHDDLRQDGQRPLWKDILTVYAVKTTTDSENPLDAVSMDEEHAEVLRTIFWDMTVIEFTTETYTEEITVEVPTEDAPTGKSSYASKYALSERLVCGECGTLYRRCTWSRNGRKRVVWRCVSRLDYGTKYCHNSPTLDEEPLQKAILTALNAAMSNKPALIQKITEAMEMELVPFPGENMSLADIERRLSELNDQTRELVAEAACAEDASAFTVQLKAVMDEVTTLKAKRTQIQEQRQGNAQVMQRVQSTTAVLEGAPAEITEWEEALIRQLVDTVKVVSADQIIVFLWGGGQIEQPIVH